MIRPAIAEMVEEISGTEDLKKIVSNSQRVALNFWTSWAAPCVQMNSVFDALAETFAKDGQVVFARVSAEKLPQIAADFHVIDVPAFVLLHDGRLVARVDGANPPLLAEKVAWLVNASHDDLQRAALVGLTKRSKVMLFMKGAPDAPKCRFSRQIVDILRKNKVQFDYFDILEDLTVRSGLKVLYNWPTYPQLYANGCLIGGVDIVCELSDTNQLAEELERGSDGSADVVVSESNDVTSSGKPSVDVVVEVSNDAQTAVRSRVDGTSLDCANNVAGQTGVNGTESSKQKEREELISRLRGLVSRSPVMLFMKGSPTAPQCGFSRQIVALLNEQSVKFDSFDILEDADVRQGLKELYQWPTYPQLYSKGNLIGGLDIVRELVNSDSLKHELEA